MFSVPTTTKMIKIDKLHFIIIFFINKHILNDICLKIWFQKRIEYYIECNMVAINNKNVIKLVIYACDCCHI